MLGGIACEAIWAAGFWTHPYFRLSIVVRRCVAMPIGPQAGAVESPSPAEVKSIPLLNWETDAASTMASISFVFFFKGNPQDAAIQIRCRFKAVAEANPWLLGRIARNNKHRNLQLVYPAGPISEQMIDQAVWIDPPGLDIHPEMPYNEIYAAAKKSKCVLPDGSELANKSDLVTRISISGDATEAQALVIVISMSHTVADGYTYFAIMNMLSDVGVVSVLNPTRVLEAEANMRSHFKALDDWRMSAGFRLNAMCCSIWSSIFGTKRTNVVLRRLDHTKIADARKHATEHVSTNDIITCSFVKATSARVATMLVDHRGRAEGVTHDLAGNYVSNVAVDKRKCETPEGVREILKAGFSSNCGMPKFFETLLCKEAVISNISHLPCLSLPGCEHVLQFPLVSIEGRNLSEICWVLKCDSKDTCLIHFSKEHDDRFVSENFPVGEEVSPSIFRDGQGEVGRGTSTCEIIALTVSIVFMLVAYSVNVGITGYRK